MRTKWSCVGLLLIGKPFTPPRLLFGRLRGTSFKGDLFFVGGVCLVFFFN